MYHRNIDDAILFYLISLNSYYHKHYCYPSQRKILRYLQTDHTITCCRRTLNYHLKKLELLGFIERIRRLSQNHQGLITFKTTLYFVKKKAYKYLYYIKNKLLSALDFFKRPLKQKTPDQFSKPKPFLSDVELDERFKHPPPPHLNVE